VDSGEPADIINPAKIDVITGEATCLECHRGHAFEAWEASEHRSASVRCTSCHTLHVPAVERAYERISDRCFECHSEVRAAGYMPSRHPIAEGKMECTDCHNVHGGMEPWVLDGSAREMCLQCHAQYEGPFLFEHAPVAEDCLHCHLPHGAVADFLLKQSEPTLCLNCHSMHFHAGVVGVDGPFTAPQAPDRGGVSTPDAWKRVMLTKCTQCHSEIHGTDLPSQSISGQGGALTR
jgi:DmsE family decaheme c-type cytochrome